MIYDMAWDLTITKSFDKNKSELYVVDDGEIG